MKWLWSIGLCLAGFQVQAQHGIDSLNFPIRELVLLNAAIPTSVAPQLKEAIVLDTIPPRPFTINIFSTKWPSRSGLHALLLESYQQAARKRANLLIIKTDTLLTLRQLIELSGELTITDRPNFMYFPDEQQFLVNLNPGKSRNLHERKLKSGDLIGKYNGKLMNDNRLTIPQTDTSAGNVYTYRAIDSTLSGRLVHNYWWSGDAAALKKRMVQYAEERSDAIFRVNFGQRLTVADYQLVTAILNLSGLCWEIDLRSNSMLVYNALFIRNHFMDGSIRIRI